MAKLWKITGDNVGFCGIEYVYASSKAEALELVLDKYYEGLSSYEGDDEELISIKNVYEKATIEEVEIKVEIYAPGEHCAYKDYIIETETGGMNEKTGQYYETDSDLDLCYTGTVDEIVAAATAICDYPTHTPSDMHRWKIARMVLKNFNCLPTKLGDKNDNR